MDNLSRSGKEYHEVFTAQAACSALADLQQNKKERGFEMEEETTQKTIALVMNGAKLSARELRNMMKMYLDHHSRQKSRTSHRKTVHKKVSVKELVGQDAGAKTIEISDSNIKCFEQTAKKYNIDFAVKKDRTKDPPKYLVFFKAKDQDVMEQAFREFVYVNEKKKERPSVREKLNRSKEVVSLNKNREKSLEKNKDRGQSL